MSRQEDFVEAGIQYRMEHGKPMAIGGDKFADVANEMNRCKDFEAGAEYGYQYAVDKACKYIGNYLGMALSCYPIDIDVLVKDKFVSKFVESIRKAMEDMSNEQENKRKRGTTAVIQTNEKSANSVSITNGRTDVTDGTLPEGAIIMQ